MRECDLSREGNLRVLGLEWHIGQMRELVALLALTVDRCRVGHVSEKQLASFFSLVVPFDHRFEPLKQTLGLVRTATCALLTESPANGSPRW